MLEIIALIFLTRQIGEKAAGKGLQPGKWKIAAVLAWIAAEFIGIAGAIIVFGNQNLFAIFSTGIMCAIGGYLIVHYLLDKTQGTMNDDIDRIGTDQLKP